MVQQQQEQLLDMKSRKEAFVTGHGGSEHPWEVLWVCSSLLWGCWLYAEWILWRREHERRPGKRTRIVAEAVLVWFPMILAQTNYLYPYGSLVLLEQIHVAGTLYWKRTRNQKVDRKGKESEQDNNNKTNTNTNSNHDDDLHLSQPHRCSYDYLTMYRSTIYFLTFCAILAVDFPLFPRRFCKTEVHGYGLMDVGAASFVISSGIVSGKAYSTQQRQQQQRQQRRHKRWYFRSLAKPLLKAAPLLVIGILRCITNKELEYQEHVSEYGVHWNFFFTLGVLAVVPTIRKNLLLDLKEQQQQHQHRNVPNNNTQEIQDNNPHRRMMKVLERWVFWAPLVAVLLYQYELVLGREDSNGLEQFILTAPRSPSLDCEKSIDVDTDASFFLRHFWRTKKKQLVCLWMRFFYANREGILGCIGYSFLHAVGEWVGHRCVFGERQQRKPPTPTPTTTSTTTFWRWPLTRATLVSWIALYALNYTLDLPVSRRETNLPFCLWALAHNLTILLGFQLLTESVVTTAKNHEVLGPGFGAVNRHGLASFLVANLLTGLVNLLVPTIDQGDGLAMGILVVYLLAVGGTALLLDQLGVAKRRRDKTPMDERNNNNEKNNDDDETNAAKKKN